MALVGINSQALPRPTENAAQQSRARTASEVSVDPGRSNARPLPGSGTSPSAPVQQNPAPPTTPEPNTLSLEDLQQLVDRIGEQISITRRSLAFSINENLGRTILTVTDVDTGEIVRQIPAEEIVRVAETMKDLNESLSGGGPAVEAIGLLIQEQA